MESNQLYESFVEQAQAVDPRERAAAQRALPAFPLKPDVAVSMVRLGLADRSKEVRLAALRSLESRPHIARAVFAELLDLLRKERSELVRSRCELALYAGGPGHADHVPVLAKLLANRKDDVRRVAATALKQMGSEAVAAAPALVQAAKDGHDAAGQAAVSALIAIMGKEFWWKEVESQRP